MLATTPKLSISLPFIFWLGLELGLDLFKYLKKKKTAKNEKRRKEIIMNERSILEHTVGIICANEIGHPVVQVVADHWVLVQVPVRTSSNIDVKVLFLRLSNPNKAKYAIIAHF